MVVPTAIRKLGTAPMPIRNRTICGPRTHFGLKGPSATFVDRENATFAALDQAVRWLRAGLAEVALVLGTDGLFPLLMDICRGARLLDRHRDPEVGFRPGLLPGEGAQAFLLESRVHAEARGARPRALLRALACRSTPDHSGADRYRALSGAVAALGGAALDRRIGGGNGLSRLDTLESLLARSHPDWPAAVHPKVLWGEFGGSGGQLLAAALLEPAERALVTAPASSGAQFAALLEEVSLDPR